MVAQAAPKVKAPVKLIDQQILTASARTGSYVNLVGLDFLHPTAQARAYVRGQAEGLRAYHTHSNEWMVPSASHPGEAHRVYVWGSGASQRIACDCPAGQSRRVCKHAELVRHELDRTEPVAF